MIITQHHGHVVLVDYMIIDFGSDDTRLYCIQPATDCVDIEASTLYILSDNLLFLANVLCESNYEDYNKY